MKALHLFLIFFKLGCTSFGGPVAHLAYFRQEFVKQRKWFSEPEYGYLLSICQLIPGPASSQVGFAIGLLRGGWLGAISAFVAFTLPSVMLLLLFANSLHLLDSLIGRASLEGLAILAFVVVLQAVLGMGKQLITNKLTWLLCLAVFTLVLLTSNIMFALSSIAVCAAINALFAKHESENSTTRTRLFLSPHLYLPSRKTALIASVMFVIVLSLFMTNPRWLTQLSYEHASIFFMSGASVFGGGHVVLPFLEQTTVTQGLISQDAFLAGYGATQAVPGPMFSFAAYLGFIIDAKSQVTEVNTVYGLYRALSSALLAIFYLFLPGFLLISAVLPVSQELFAHTKVKQAFVGANAAVIGLLAATLYDPIFTHAIGGSVDIVIAGIGFVLLTRLKVPVILIVCTCVLLKIVEALVTT